MGCPAKAIDIVGQLQKDITLPGWLKTANWRAELKNLMRSLGRASGSGGKGKQKRVKNAAQKYLVKATALLNKLELLNEQFQPGNIREAAIIMTLRGYMQHTLAPNKLGVIF